MKTNPMDTAPPKRRRWLFKLGWICFSLIVLLVAGYFLTTSDLFFQRVVLPRVGRSIDATVTVSQASVHPFSQVLLHDLKIQPQGEEPVLVVKELRVRYHLMDLLRGQIGLEEAVVDSPTVRIIRKADGTSNLDPILQALSQEEPSPTPPSAPLRFDMKKLVVSDAALDFTQTDLNGDTFRAEIAELDLELAGIKNGQTARLTLEGRFALNTTSQTNVSEVAGTLKGDFTTDLADDLMPDRAEGQAELAIPTATGAFADAAGLTTTLRANLDSTAVEQLALQFTKGEASIGALSVSGPFNLRTREGTLTVAVNGIGSEVLSLVGGRYDVSFGETKIAASCAVELKNQAKRISAIGSLTGAACSLTRGALVTPKVDFQLDYNLAADLLESQATLGQFTIQATQNGSPLLRGALTREMRIGWGPGEATVPDSMFELELTQLDLARWQALIGNEVMAGILNGKLGLTVQKAGQSVTFDLATELVGLSAQHQSNRINDVSVVLTTRGEVTDFSLVDLADFNVRATHAGQPVIWVKGSGKYNTVTREADVLTELEASLAQAAGLLASPNGRLTSGTVKFTGRIAQTNPTPAQTNSPALNQEVVGELQLTNLVVRDAAGRLSPKPLEARLTLDVSRLQDRLDLRSVQLALTPTERADNLLELSGLLDMSRSNTIAGNLKLRAESLDLTSYYDAAEAQQSSVAAEPTSPSSSAQQMEIEPAAVELPLRAFVGTVEIARLYLRELAITDLLATANLDGGKVRLDPVQLTLNGAPATAEVDLNMGIPGYQYSVNFEARAVPVAPLLNTFQPDRKGQMSGTLTTVVQVTGAGVTGPNLQKNLTAQFDVGTTNLNLKLIDVRSSLLKSVINVIIGLPDIIRSPGGALNSIAKNLSSSGEPSGGGWVDEVSGAPIDVVLLQGQVGNGRVEVQQALVQSLTFRVETRGPVMLSANLTNSTIEFPVEMALRRSLAEKIGQTAPETAADASYVKLPAFLTLQGTVGDPKKKLNFPVLGQMALKLGGGIMGGSAQATAEQVSDALGGLTDAFGARGSTEKKPSTNSASPKGMLDRFLPRQAPATNAAPAKANPSF